MESMMVIKIEDAKMVATIPITDQRRRALMETQLDMYAFEAVPVVHARWVKVHGYCTPGGDPVWRCSECGKGIHVYGIEHGTYGADIADGQWVACPNCGAKMMEG